MKLNNNVVLAVVITFLATGLLFVVINELHKAQVRTHIVSELNAAWPKLKNNSDKVAVIVSARTALAQNQSWFNFLNSKADEQEKNEDAPPLEAGDRSGFGAYLSDFLPKLQPNVDTGWTWQLPASSVETSGVSQDNDGNWHDDSR